MPRSRKGKNKRRHECFPVPIMATLAAKLRAAAAGRPDNAPLLVDGNGESWQAGCQTQPFRLVALAAGLDPDVVTPNALRHSHIVAQLLAGVPIRLVGSLHDTSSKMIEATYSKHIAGVGEEIARRVLIDFDGATPAGNVVALR